MPELTCKKCGVVQDESTVVTERVFLPNNRDYHLKALCNSCGAYIKFLAHDPVPKFHFGKYNGYAISEVARYDPEYLRWLLSQDIKPKLRKTIMDTCGDTL